jgi:hypothetical protein
LQPQNKKKNMSVELTSKNGNVCEGISNGGWQAIIVHARAFNDEVPAWNGCHDGQEWTTAHLKLMADRLEQSAKFIPILRELADDGGVTIS